MKFIIATHGYLAKGYVSSIKVLTQKDNIYALNAYVDEDFDVSQKIKELLDTFDKSEEVIIFTDIMSGSMTQNVSKFLDDKKIHCITGINLPLILEFVLTGEKIDEAFIENTIEEARKQIMYINKLI